MILYYGSYYYRGPASDWKRINLGRDLADAMTRHGDLFRETGLRLFKDVCDQYELTVIPTKAPRTQTDNRRHLKPIRTAFCNMKPRTVRPVHVYRFRDTLVGLPGIVQANLTLALLKNLFTKAIEWEAVETNSAKEARKIPHLDRDRYPEDWDLNSYTTLRQICCRSQWILPS